jgi:hypothetical protein
MTDQYIIGAGGGGKSGGGAGGGAEIAKDNLDSTQVARIIDLLCEGEIAGFPSARNYSPGTTAFNNALLKDVFLNNTPILRAGASDSNPQDSDFNFQRAGAVFEFRSGTQNQAYTDTCQPTHNCSISRSYFQLASHPHHYRHRCYIGAGDDWHTATAHPKI